MTLVFLGYRPEEEIDAIAAAAFGGRWRAVGAPRLTPPGVRPLPPRRPRLFALDLDDQDGRAAAVQAAARRRWSPAAGTGRRSARSGRT